MPSFSELKSKISQFKADHGSRQFRNMVVSLCLFFVALVVLYGAMIYGIVKVIKWAWN